MKKQPLETVIEEIRAIQKSVEILKQSDLKENVLLLLIQEACPRVYRNNYNQKTKIPISDIKAVLEGLASIEEKLLAPHEDPS